MTEKIQLGLNDFSLTFKIQTQQPNQFKIQFYLSFFNRFPELIDENDSEELLLLFDKLFPTSKLFFQLQDNAQKFVDIINNLKLNNVPSIYQESFKEETILYIHSCARLIFDFIFERTNQDYFLIIDNIINSLNHIFQFDDYIIPWYDYTQEKLDYIDFELSKMNEEDTDQKFLDYFKSLSDNKTNFIHRTSEELSIDEDFKLQKLLADAFFKSSPEEQNLIPYLLNKIIKENNHSIFEIHSLIPINDQYPVSFIFTMKLVDNKFVFAEKNPLFFNLIIKALGAYFSKTKTDSNLFIRAINPNVDILSYNKDMTKEKHNLNEIYGFFFSENYYSFGLNKEETKKILEHDLYTLKYKKPKPGTFYVDASDIFSQYATDKALALILGDIKIAYNK